MPNDADANNLTIRPATIDDAETILGFINELADFEKLSHEVVATPELLRRFLFGDKPAAEVLIAEVAGEPHPVGFCLFFTSFSTFLGRPGIYLEDLYIQPDHRGRGYGEQLLRRLASLAVEREYGRLEWSVLDWNEHAIRFYRRAGAFPMDEWTVWRLTGDALTNFADGPGDASLPTD